MLGFREYKTTLEMSSTIINPIPGESISYCLNGDVNTETRLMAISSSVINLHGSKYFILEKPFPKNTSIWQNQAIQREFLLESTDFANDEDYIFFSDPDEIPKPEVLKNFNLKKKYGIFMQKCFNFKFNLFNKYESPWEGTRVCKKKNLKSIDFMRQKVKTKNLKYSFFRFDKEKSVQIFDDAGWHFNNILSSEEISLKLKTFAHSQFADEKYSSPMVIEKKIEKKIDLFERGHIYKKVEIDDTFPEYLKKNLHKFKNFIIN